MARDSRFVGIAFPREKFVAETALLLYTAAPLAATDCALCSEIEDVALTIQPLARSDEVRAAICLDASEALDNACAHILLGAAGYRDDAMNELLSESLKVDTAPERLPHRLLEQAWLRGLFGRSPDDQRSVPIGIEGTMLTRPVDALRASRMDFYGFTHAVMYASDFGASPPSLADVPSAEASAIAALAFSLDTLDYDLAVETLLTWPMLRLPWTPAAALVFDWLARTEELRGFLTGISFDPDVHAALSEDQRDSYVVATCYHAVYVMAFLCASALRWDAPPPKFIGGHGGLRTDSGRLDGVPWAHPDTSAAARLAELPTSEEFDGLAPLLLTSALREAASKGDARALRSCLQFALDQNLTDVLAVGQATTLLRRLSLLDPSVQNSV